MLIQTCPGISYPCDIRRKNSAGRRVPAAMFFPDYTALWMRWAVCAKEPVLHPSEVSPDDDADNRQQ